MIGPANVAVPASADLVAIIAKAGAVQSQGFYQEGKLYVSGVSQQDLQAAVDAVGTAPVVPPKGNTYKADIWRRCSDAEAATLDAALDAAPSRLRRLFDDADYIDPSDADYPMIREAVVAALGQTRADQVLAPS